MNKVNTTRPRRAEKLKAGQARMPPTKFGRPVIRKDGAADLSTMRWASVAQHETEKVVDWVHFLHQHNHVGIRLLLRAVFLVLGTFSRTEATPPHILPLKTRLPCALMEILSEPDMFSSEASFKVCRTFPLFQYSSAHSKCDSEHRLCGGNPGGSSCVPSHVRPHVFS